MNSDNRPTSRYLTPVVATVLGFVTGTVISDIGLGIVWATLAGVGTLLYTTARRGRNV